MVFMGLVLFGSFFLRLVSCRLTFSIMPNPFVVVNLFCKKKRSFFSAPLPGPVPGPPGEARAQLVDQDGVGHARARPARALEGERAKGAAGALVGEGQEGAGAREGDHGYLASWRRWRGKVASRSRVTRILSTRPQALQCVQPRTASADETVMRPEPRHSSRMTRATRTPPGRYTARPRGGPARSTGGCSRRPA